MPDSAIAVGVTVLIETVHTELFDVTPLVLLGRKGAFSSTEGDRASFEGKWVTPGGRVNVGETLLDAVIRETREETGVVLEKAAPWFVQEMITPTGHYILHVFKALVPSALPLVAGDDLTDVRWVSLKEACRLWDAMTPLTQDILERTKYNGKW